MTRTQSTDAMKQENQKNKSNMSTNDGTIAG